MATVNPIQHVRHNSASGTPISIPSPSVFKWDLQDVSAADAGRTEDTVMHKKRIGQCVKIELEWHNITTAVASQILNAFNPQYIWVSYLDPKANAFVQKEMYVGDRSAPMYNATMGLWSNVSFNIIERSGR